MRIVILGGTGFIGRALVSHMLDAGYEVAVPSRNPQKAAKAFGGRVVSARFDGERPDDWGKFVDGAKAVINLVGENISDGRWTAAKKKRILESRVNAGKAVVEAVRQAGAKPEVVIQASAVGWYGDTGPGHVDESSEAGEGFLADVCRKWEASSAPVEDMGVRRVVVRSGLVLGNGGILERVLPPFRCGVGGPLGSGKQGVSWIHIVDEVAAIRFLMENEKAQGTYNLAAPEPVAFKVFARTLGRVLLRPVFLGVPAVVLKIVMGEMADELLLSGQFAVPARLSGEGFEFSFPRLEDALRNLLK